MVGEREPIFQEFPNESDGDFRSITELNVYGLRTHM